MSQLSHKQILFRDFLLKRLGFVQDDFLNEYADALEKASPRFRYLGKEKKVFDEFGENPKPEFDKPFTEYEDKGDYYLPTKFNIIDFLDYELNLKRKKGVKLKHINNSYVTATDLSNYTYCPVSFAINRTIETEKIESAIIGTSIHEKNILLNYLKPFQNIEFVGMAFKEVESQLTFVDLINEQNQNFIEEVKKSEILFSGHTVSENEKKYFNNKKENYYGQPDYIFKNKTTDCVFVVEEKFQFVPKDPIQFEYSRYTQEEEQKIIKKRNEDYFFQNHINQLNSYIHGIIDYPIKYGYLVYWKYEMDNGYPYIISCSVLKVNKTEQGKESFIDIFQKVYRTMKNNGGQFDLTTRNPSKCSSCVSNVLCGHKTGKYKDFTFPYNLKFLNLSFAEFPEELKKKEEKTKQTDV